MMKTFDVETRTGTRRVRADLVGHKGLGDLVLVNGAEVQAVFPRGAWLSCIEVHEAELPAPEGGVGGAEFPEVDEITRPRSIYDECVIAAGLSAALVANEGDSVVRAVLETIIRHSASPRTVIELEAILNGSAPTVAGGPAVNIERQRPQQPGIMPCAQQDAGEPGPSFFVFHPGPLVG